MPAAVELRLVVRADADAMAAVLGEPVAALRDWFTALESRRSPDGSEGWFTWIVLVGGEPAGYVQATVRGTTAELAWVIGPARRRQGLATAAVGILIDLVTAELGVCDLIATISPANAASQRVAERNGLVPSDATADGETIWRATR